MNDQQEMDENGVTRFIDIRFPQGTRLKMVRLQFAVDVEYVQSDGSLGKALVESDTSNPFIGKQNLGLLILCPFYY